MTRNVGGIDKKLRIILGIVFIVGGLFAPMGAGLKTVSFVLAGIALFTGIVGL